MSDWEIIEDSEWEPINKKPNLPTKGWSGVGQDLLSLIKNSPEMIEKLSQNIIEGTPRQISGLAENPERIPQGLASGLLSVPHGIASIPSSVGNYLAEKEIISPEAASNIPRPPFSPHELVGLEGEKPGDVITELVGGFAAGGPNGFGAIKSAGKGTVTLAKQGVKNAKETLSDGQLGQMYRGVSNSRTGEVMKEAYKKDLEHSKKLYSDLFKSAEQKGIKEIPFNIDEKDFDLLKDLIPESYAANLEKAFNENNLENFHKAQSDLLKFSRLIKKRSETNPELSAHMREAGKKAKDISEKIQDAISRELMNKGGMELLFKNINATENYAKNVVPWFDLQSIKGSVKERGQKGFRYPEHLPKEAGHKKANAFLSGKGQEIPELIINRKLASPYGKLLKLIMGIDAVGNIIQE